MHKLNISYACDSEYVDVVDDECHLEALNILATNLNINSNLGMNIRLGRSGKTLRITIGKIVFDVNGEIKNKDEGNTAKIKITETMKERMHSGASEYVFLEIQSTEFNTNLNNFVDSMGGMEKLYELCINLLNYNRRNIVICQDIESADNEEVDYMAFVYAKKGQKF